jgi:cytochrome c-type biogenesis protein
VIQIINSWFTDNFTLTSSFSLVLVFGAGVLTSLTPCTLSMIPITIGYLGGYGNDRPWGQTFLFTAGFATTLTGLGLGAAFLGRVYGQTGWGWSIAMGTIAVVMGLQLLGLVQLPQWSTIALEKYVPPPSPSLWTGAEFWLSQFPLLHPPLGNSAGMGSPKSKSPLGRAPPPPLCLGFLPPFAN